MISTPTLSVNLVLPNSVEEHSQVRGTLEITNKGSEKVELVSPNYNAALNLVVFDCSWNAVPANSLGKAHIARESFELSPGQTVGFDLPNLTFTTGTSQMSYQLKPGSYYILAVYHPGTAKLPEQGFYPIAISSNVNKLVIV